MAERSSNLVERINDIQPGDHVVFDDIHCIVVDVADGVTVVFQENGELETDTLDRCKLTSLMNNRKLHRILYDQQQCASSDVIVERANRELEYNRSDHYCAILTRCEQFPVWCRTGMLKVQLPSVKPILFRQATNRNRIARIEDIRRGDQVEINGKQAFVTEVDGMVTVVHQKEKRMEKLVMDEQKLERLYQSREFFRINDGEKFSSVEVEKAIARANREEEYSRASHCYSVPIGDDKHFVLWCKTRMKPELDEEEYPIPYIFKIVKYAGIVVVVAICMRHLFNQTAVDSTVESTLDSTV